MTQLLEERLLQIEGEIDFAPVLEPMAGDPAGKSVLSMRQFDAHDIHNLLEEAHAAEVIIRDPRRRGISLLPFVALKTVMRQPSTRTAGSMDTAMQKLGGLSEVISGMQGSSEAKGESLSDSWLAFATQSDVLGIRTAEDFGPTMAAQTIADYYHGGKLPEMVPVINLGDGRNEHPTQGLGDLYTIRKELGRLSGRTIVLVGDHERYRAFHSDMLGALIMDMQVIAVESEAAQVPQSFVEEMGSNLERTDDLDAAMRRADVLIMGRNPDEYSGDDEAELQRSQKLSIDYASWVVDLERLQQMSRGSIILHPRPRRNELHPSVDFDPRAKDVEQMANMIPIRMAIIAGTQGRSIRAATRPPMLSRILPDFRRRIMKAA